MRAFGFFVVICATFALSACSDDSKINSIIAKSQPDATLSDFQPVTREEYAAVSDEFFKPRDPSRSAKNYLRLPQFETAKFYSIKATTRNAFGNDVMVLRYCIARDDKFDCGIRKSANSTETATRANLDG